MKIQAWHYIVLSAILAPVSLLAQTLSTTASSSPGTVIPPDNASGLVETLNLTTPLASIDGVTVSLDISGGYNGDYYAYLEHSDAQGTSMSVLLNCVGESAGNPYGSPDGGMNITLSDSASVNVHDASASGGLLTGTYQPDGRNISPFSDPGVLDGTPSTATLGSFDGMNPNGEWELFIADVSPGGVGTLESWGLTVALSDDPVSAAVPEPPSFGVLAIAGAGLALLRRRFPRGLHYDEKFRIRRQAKL